MTERNSTYFDLSGKVVVVTGAAGLLGRRHADAIANYGGTPILIDINTSDLDIFVSELQSKYDVPCKAYKVDITDESSLSANVNELASEFGKIDGLVNNAANNPKVEDNDSVNFSRLENFPLDVWNKDIAVGLTGAYLCSKWYGAAIAKNAAGGSIVNISSDLGLIAPDQRLYFLEGLDESLQPVKPVTYSVVKSGLIGLSRYLSTYWPEKNVRSNVICPGGVFNGHDDEFLSKVSSRIPMGRMAHKDEMQGALVFLLSSASSYVTGAVLSVDGGRSAW